MRANLAWKTLAVSTAALAAAAFSATASAQERPWTEQKVDAPTNAVETTIATGYTQPFGLLKSGTNINDVAGAAIGFEAGVGYRLVPELSLGISAQYQEMQANAAGASAIRGGSADIHATYHFMPYDRMDPWVQLGTGYRMMWTVATGSGTNVLDHGFELVRGLVGMDLRTDPNVSIGPMVGADVNLFVWQRPEGGTNTTITDPRVNTFVFAGVQGRLDVGNTEPAPTTVARAASR